MSLEPEVASSRSPKYCYFFKTLLVEELELETSYHNLHYGQCALIGRLAFKSNQYRLENVRVKCLPKKYSLDEGTLSVLILGLTHDKIVKQRVSAGRYCIVRGEVVLHNVQHPKGPKLTAGGVYDKINSLSNNPLAQTQYLTALRATYRPAIDFWYIQVIDRAEDLLTRRLEMRSLIEK
ncbi:uncharacterized protein LOC6535535 [Drosophila yakuba]|uniref:Uncharacterized protein n=1 Tax=Drosophila yakuba TaxID=7245 RepID=A0A0R1E0F3_DROYA|nr:uncharacterized protein LOC6535535 [Drosophila yakuba]KRK02779.1 uncharacterized protein Dyak_GE25528 [Drosophila yakuba]